MSFGSLRLNSSIHGGADLTCGHRRFDETENVDSSLKIQAGYLVQHKDGPLLTEHAANYGALEFKEYAPTQTSEKFVVASPPSKILCGARMTGSVKLGFATWWLARNTRPRHI